MYNVQVAVAADSWISEVRDFGGVNSVLDPVGCVGMGRQEVEALGARCLAQHCRLQIAVRLELAQKSDHCVRVVARPGHVACAQLVSLELLFARKRAQKPQCHELRSLHEYRWRTDGRGSHRRSQNADRCERLAAFLVRMMARGNM